MTVLRVYPNYDELLLIEQTARRERAAEMGRLAALAASKVQALMRQSLVALSHGNADKSRSQTGGERGTRTLAAILDDLYAALPDEFRARYSQELMTAARVAPAIDLTTETLGLAVRLAARTFHGLAQGLRAGAWCLDVAARRLMPFN